MNIETMKRVHRLQAIIHLFESQAQRRWRTREIAERLGINEDTANKYLNELQVTGLLPITKEGLYWFLPEGAVIPRLQLSLSYPEAVGLYLAGRLLAQTRDERNWHLTMALHKLLEALPAPVREQQGTIAALLLTEDTEREDFSAIFLALACGWVQHRRVQLTYEPPRKSRFETLFDPYLLEPSAIGRTIYVLGYSHAVQALRTLKLERIRHAKLTSESFDPDPSFKAEELLQRAWGVMYGDEEPVRVRLHFSSQVVKRVRETRWHPSQEIRLTRDGCEWTALIGDLVEIEPWVRGWGADCVVLEPEELRARVISHVQRACQQYGLQPAPASAHEPGRLNPDLFRRPARPDEASDQNRKE
uniref:DNA-binding transcriptional regulator n=1 Tax=Thermogemmatispora argillosa TaxID=2045280 RepID=A0A455SY22_9CHLR|nr:DNA-binding transcriptional regulator [Thermogemmatispora argillosa]